MCQNFVTNPVHGGKVTCHKCNQFIDDDHEDGWMLFSAGVYFHNFCFNRYEHYYGLDKPID